MEDRAAQFSPFAALTGFDDTISESDRQVEQFADFDENYLQELDGKLQFIQERISMRPQVEITYFVPDGTKKGGTYKTARGGVKRIDKYKRQVCFEDRRSVCIDNIKEITVLDS